MYDEINTSFEQLVPADADGAPVLRVMQVRAADVCAGSGLVLIEKLIRTVISRTSNRVFIGLPLCTCRRACPADATLTAPAAGRDPGYLDVSINSTLDFGAALRFLAIFPPALKPYAAKFISSVDRCVAQSLAHLGPTIEDRIRHVREFGDAWADKPVRRARCLFLLCTLTQAAERHAAVDRGRDLRAPWLWRGRRRPVPALHQLCRHRHHRCRACTRYARIRLMLMLLQTTTHALYDILSHPEHIPALRTEAERVIGTHGWTKDAIDRLELLDSFLRESQRYNGINIGAPRPAPPRR